MAANILQSASTHLAHVALVFGMLYWHFHTARIAEGASTDTELASDTIISSVEKRWRSADQDIMIAAIILHPSLKLRPFNPSKRFSYADVVMLMA